MIQDIMPHRLQNQYDPMAKPEKEDLVICFFHGDFLVKAETEIVFPRVCDFPDAGQLTYLFSIDSERYFLKMAADGASVSGFSFENLRALRERKLGPKYRMFAVLTAKHLMDWYRDNAFCGRCGKQMRHDKKERAMACECGYKSYPRIMPAVIVGVKNKDSLLLTKYRGGFRHNALIAGFTEIGETFEETVAREVMEEAGIKVKNIRYYKSQPWGIANDILAGYYCEVDGDTTIHMDEEELGYAEWVKRDEIELQPDDFSLTNEMMYMFKTGQE